LPSVHMVDWLSDQTHAPTLPSRPDPEAGSASKGRVPTRSRSSSSSGMEEPPPPPATYVTEHDVSSTFLIPSFFCATAVCVGRVLFSGDRPSSDRRGGDLVAAGQACAGAVAAGRGYHGSDRHISVPDSARCCSVFASAA